MKNAYLYLACKNLKSQKILYMIIFVQIIIMNLIIISSICIFESKFALVKAVNSLATGNGFVVLTNGIVDENNMAINNSEQLEAILPGTEITCSSIVLANAEQYNRQLDFQIWAYDEKLIASYIPQLEHGNWLNNSSQISEIPAVISKEANELKIGDVVELTSLFEDTNSLSDIPLKVRIVGELAEGARIPGYQIGNEININDTWLFNSVYSDNLISPVMILPQKAIEENKKEIDNTSIITMVNDLMWVRQKKSDSNMQKQYKYLQKNNAGMIEKFSVIRDNNTKELIRWLIPLFPIFTLSLLITILCETGGVLLSMKIYQRRYIVYNICGATIQECRIIHVITHMFLHIAGFISASFLILEINHINNNIISKTLLQINKSVSLVVILVCILSGGLIWRMTKDLWEFQIVQEKKMKK